VSGLLQAAVTVDVPAGRLPGTLGGPDAPAAELPAGLSLDDVHARVTRNHVCVYRGHGPDIRLLAVWRWSRIRGRLVTYDRREPEWSPAWSLELAERAWREAH
jgi:hypothetical protein